MRENIKIKTKNKKYNILIENESIKKFFKNKNNYKSKKYIIIDSKVANKINKYLLNKKNINIIKIKASEKIKSFSFYQKIIHKILEKKIDRSSTIIAVGGGTIGDLAGFISSTILRGVEFILMPTTLLAQVDSSIGGKNGINTRFGKNQIGTFYQPDKVIIDPNILKSLPKNQLRSGYAEIFKHSIINDKKFYIWLKDNFKKIYSLETKALMYAISKSIKIKSKFVKRDEKEKLINSSSRAMLNFGHTFGHAIEALNNYKSSLLHGEAISVGMVIASKISYKLGKIKKKDYEDICTHFKNASLPRFNKNINKSNFYKIILSDKKNTNGKINLILLKKIGKAYYARDLNISKIKKLIK